MQNHSVSTSFSAVSALPLLPEACRQSRLPGVGPSTGRSLRVSPKIYRTTFAGRHKYLNKSRLHLHPIVFTMAAPTENHQSIQVPYHRISTQTFRITILHDDGAHFRFWTRLDDSPFNPPIRTHNITTYPHRSPSALFSTSFLSFSTATTSPFL